MSEITNSLSEHKNSQKSLLLKIDSNMHRQIKAHAALKETTINNLLKSIILSALQKDHLGLSK